MDEKVQEKLGRKEIDKENGENYKGFEKEVIGETFLKVTNKKKEINLIFYCTLFYLIKKDGLGGEEGGG